MEAATRRVVSDKQTNKHCLGKRETESQATNTAGRVRVSASDSLVTELNVNVRKADFEIVENNTLLNGNYSSGILAG